MLLIVSSIPCWAKPKKAVATDSKPKRVRLEQGKPAPFSGVLMSNAALAKLISDYERKLKVAVLDTEKTKRELDAEQKTHKVICQAIVTAEQAKLEACKDDKERQRVIYETALKKCSKDQPWFKTPFFGYIMGNVVAGGVCAAVSVSR